MVSRVTPSSPAPLSPGGAGHTGDLRRLRETFAPAGRSSGIDAARGLALFGMMATHVVAFLGPDGLPTWATVFAGRASALFAILAGVSVVLATRRVLDAPDGRGWARAAAGLVARGIVIALVGLALELFTASIAVILVNYGVMFVLAAAFLRCPTWLLGLLAPAWLVGTPFLSHAIRAATDATPEYTVPGFSMLATPGTFAEAILLTGYYPVIVWFGYLLVGMLLARLAAGRTWTPVTGLLLVCGGGALAAFCHAASTLLLTWKGLAVLEVLTNRYPPYAQGSLEAALVTGSYGTTPTDSWWWLAIAGPHSGTPLDLLSTTGLAIAVLGLCIAADAALKDRTWALAPLSAPGSMPLSIYCGHVVAVEITKVTLPQTPAGDFGEFVLHVVLAVVFAIGWKLFVGARGPLEWPVTLATKGVHRALGARMER
ncbi:heparan-alpha-glucosaminide N-acetyltransferase domain-containing protein [Brevibacterium litoralis]|uniref:heparan-alpha-glucosaminide N-acetyltransferase domain-containing protein n=1 Tax=Brevibacterium litoralis TaxID=3138935 RepID=UPI0032ED9D43